MSVGRPTPEQPILRITHFGLHAHEYLGPFASLHAALDAARAVRRLLRSDPDGWVRYQIDTGMGPYFDEVEWELRQDEWWPVGLRGVAPGGNR